MADIDNNYVYGRGEIYFNKWAEGTKTGPGERYLGNTPEFSLTSASETLDHYDSDHGVNQKDDSLDISNDLTGAITTDNINSENVALFFTGEVAKFTVVGATAIVNANITVQRGLTYQLGESTAFPQGVAMVDNVTAKKVVAGATPSDPPTLTTITLDGNFDIDLETARVYVKPTAPGVADGDVVQFTYDQEATTREVVIGKTNSARGSLRFISTNPRGKKRDVYLPSVKMTPNGDYSLKGDDWQVFGFNLEVLKKDGTTERIYVTSRPGVKG